MYIVLHCGGMPFNGNTIGERSLGGSESAAYYMAKELAALGHHVTLFTNDQEGGKFDGVNYAWAGDITEQQPLGAHFMHYAVYTPHDVLIIQRNAQAFVTKFASKINVWWLHDLAHVRAKGAVHSQMWNIDHVLTVSEYHRQQVIDVWDLNPDVVKPIQNGIDLALFEGGLDYAICTPLKGGGHKINPPNQTRLLYSSRPERGLENLVKPEGIMERLAAIDSKYHLYVCAYDNVTEQMKPYYDYLWRRCEELSNVTNLGSLTKQELADVMRQCDAMVYPTTFEEVSCITAMECMAAGLPFISSYHAALPETCHESGSSLVALRYTSSIGGGPSVDGINQHAFIDAIVELQDEAFKNVGCETQLASAKKYSWNNAAEMVNKIIGGSFDNVSNGAVVRELMNNSDIYALKEMDKHSLIVPNRIIDAVFNELDDCYAFTNEQDWGPHYEKYYKYEADRGVEYGPENMDGNLRFEYVANLIVEHFGGDSDKGAVLDYGCAHGHYTVSLARRMPDIQFIGVDICQSNVDKATAWAESEGLTNVQFIRGQVTSEGAITGLTLDGDERLLPISLIIAAEVVEHVADYRGLVDTLAINLEEGGKFIGTTPFGPWEAIGYKEHWPWRAHVHHFDRDDLQQAFGHHPEYKIVVIPAGSDKGSYCWSFDCPSESSHTIDYATKLATMKPTQTVSLCMIVKNAETSILKTLQSAVDHVDEIIICVDETTTDNTIPVITLWQNEQHCDTPITIHNIKSPTEIGFDEARNISIQAAAGDWILWLDADEQLHVSSHLKDWLRDNMYNGYAVPQHHMSIEPLGVLKTDYPCRLFRNHHGIKFFGMVHEHPEIGLNEGVGHACLISGVQIIHPGYEDENVRRDRFMRNFTLLEQDREKYPARKLGKFLWMRDLAQVCEQELMRNGHNITEGMTLRAHEGIAIWEELFDLGETRMLIEGLGFYSTLASILGEGFEAEYRINTSKTDEANISGEQTIKAYWHSREHLDALIKLMLDEKTQGYDSRYF